MKTFRIASIVAAFVVVLASVLAMSARNPPAAPFRDHRGFEQMATVTNVLKLDGERGGTLYAADVDLPRGEAILTISVLEVKIGDKVWVRDGQLESDGGRRSQPYAVVTRKSE